MLGTFTRSRLSDQSEFRRVAVHPKSRVLRVLPEGGAATGRIFYEYLLSVSVDRAEWEEIGFSRLGSLDPIALLEWFKMVRQMSKTGIFEVIEPMSAAGV